MDWPWVALCTGYHLRGVGARPAPPCATPLPCQTVRLPGGCPAAQSAGSCVSRAARSEAAAAVSKRPALPAETNIYKQGLLLHLAGSELSIPIFQMGNSKQGPRLG